MYEPSEDETASRQIREEYEERQEEINYGVESPRRQSRPSSIPVRTPARIDGRSSHADPTTNGPRYYPIVTYRGNATAAVERTGWLKRFLRVVFHK